MTKYTTNPEIERQIEFQSRHDVITRVETEVWSHTENEVANKINHVPCTLVLVGIKFKLLDRIYGGVKHPIRDQMYEKYRNRTSNSQ